MWFRNELSSLAEVSLYVYSKRNGEETKPSSSEYGSHCVLRKSPCRLPNNCRRFIKVHSSGTISLWRWNHYAPPKRQATQYNTTQDLNLQQHRSDTPKSGKSSRPRGHDRHPTTVILSSRHVFSADDYKDRTDYRHKQQSSLSLRMNHDCEKPRCTKEALPTFRLKACNDPQKITFPFQTFTLTKTLSAD